MFQYLVRHLREPRFKAILRTKYIINLNEWYLFLYKFDRKAITH